MSLEKRIEPIASQGKIEEYNKFESQISLMKFLENENKTLRKELQQRYDDTNFQFLLMGKTVEEWKAIEHENLILKEKLQKIENRLTLGCYIGSFNCHICEEKFRQISEIIR